MNQCDIDLLVESRVKQPCEVDYPRDALHKFSENVNASRRNCQMLHSISDDLHILTAINDFPENVSNQKIN